ncbi:5-oxoprolinase (ATP-hydrolyzing) [Sporothrix schenckii 1099-18]|uniref:5-oxoprolinase (ATP-hydrolysing) n=1 Tax=Sporothrix schenckii 1099-18 TaxID=1397361 RepID=A0A0F2MN18_SPOSC|nr:5-oxoprolinase (ATP-hydrolyzing) [Sporothrix schenckii 1099-18]KJR89571.1 5-oxoprolinase (ATP-hydrolysing) [Sporothrix schenckii 1099-18]
MKGIQIAIDRGGTFTDVHAIVPGRPDDIVIKLLSVDPQNYPDAPTEGIRRVLEQALGQPVPRGQPIDVSAVASIRMGTTVATNALLERKGERSALLITKGFRDLLVIGNQARPDIFDLTVAKPGVLYEKVVEIDERVTLEGFTEDPEKTVIDPASDPALVVGLSKEVVRVMTKPDLAAVRTVIQGLYDEGFRSLSVCFMHSYTFPDHELAVARIAEDMGMSVSVSSLLQPMIKMVPRGQSATADAYLTPLIKKYLDSFRRGFVGELEDASTTRCDVMQSDGGLVSFRKFSGLRAILSGPAGGVVGYAQTSYDPRSAKPIIGFDMGGTSTDVSRYAGSYEHIFETTTAGIALQTPQLDINTVAAGGGSRLFWSNGLFKVGPESAGAHPGPACYRKGGPLTVTDANLFLGRLVPEYFPKIFGKNEDQPLDVEVTRTLFEEMKAEVNSGLPVGTAKLTAEEVALGFLRVANESMCRPIRTLTEARGHDAAHHDLAVFGGAGGQHACSIAAALGIRRVVLHRFSSILSAYGMALADIVADVQAPLACVFSEDNLPQIKATAAELRVKAEAELLDQGLAVNDTRAEYELFLHMHYEGSDTLIMIPQAAGADHEWAFADTFIERHRQEFGFTMPRDVFVGDVRIRAVGKSSAGASATVAAQEMERVARGPASASAVQMAKPVYFEGGLGWKQTPVYLLTSLREGEQVAGPAMIIDNTQTIVVAPNAVATALAEHVVVDIDVAGTRQQGPAAAGGPVLDPVQLSVFGHRFMGIAEQMGRTLQKTSVSTNIKERLDFSCALFSEDGKLVANAPHVPVHLGSMQYAVLWQHEHWKGQLKEGDVLVSNHPICGGTHLPDITVITPFFENGKIVFYVASRGHHADIGGISAGSLPPNSTELWQEGAAIESVKLVEGGAFNEAAMREHLLVRPAQYPGCSGARNLSDNLADLRAQTGANQKGIHLIGQLVKEYGLETVLFYMRAIQDNAEIAVRRLLKETFTRFGGRPMEATEFMDDGSPIKLKITIDGDAGTADFDFTGTGPEVYGSTNAPTSVTYSAIIYVLRCLVKEDIPLNQGCLTPINVIMPPRTILSPSAEAAVVGGNCVTSQRVTDVILRCFDVCAASQGCLNNLTFGKSSRLDADTGTYTPGYGYYETIAGGAGAGPGWHGTDGVHVHMTNTRITDAEIFERRYPCLVREFSLRQGSGGAGAFRGGEGCVRDIEFRQPLSAAILSDRRVHPPYGMRGGQPGAVGVNLFIKTMPNGEDRVINLGPKNSIQAAVGDRMVILTPGGGGWGHAADAANPGGAGYSNGGSNVVAGGGAPFVRGTGSVAAFQSMQNSN